MKISRNHALRILKFCRDHKDFYFPFILVCKEYDETDDYFTEVDPDEFDVINDDPLYQTFELWENLQHIDEKTTELMAKGFFEFIFKYEQR